MRNLGSKISTGEEADISTDDFAQTHQTFQTDKQCYRQKEKYVALSCGCTVPAHGCVLKTTRNNNNNNNEQN